MSGFIQLVIQFVLLLNFFGLSNAYHNLPNPWFLHSSKSLPFATREQVVETVFLDNGTSFALTAQNGTRNFALYRQFGPASNIDRAKLALSNTTNWIYDDTRVSSAVSFTIEPTNQTFCIFFLNKTNIGVQWFSPAELQWNSSATISNTNLWTGNSFKSIDYPNIELSWRNADIFFGVYSFNCTSNSSACTGHFINRFSYTGNFTVQSAYVKSNVAHSMEFDCPQCQAKARIISPGEINYVALSDLSLVLGPTVTESRQVGPNSVRAYSSNGDTFYAFMLPHPSNPGKVAVYLQQNSGTDNFVDRIQLEPSIPQSLASQRLAIAVNVNYIVVAFVTDKISIQSNWHGVWYNSVQGDQDSNMEVVVAEINRANFLPSAMLIFSTKGNDTVFNVDIGLDRRITIMGTTEGHVSSPSTSTNLNMNGAFVVAKFQPFIIDKVLSVVTGIDIEEGEVVDSSNFTVTFKPVPLGMSIYDHPSVYFDTLQCTSSMLNTTTLIVTPPIILNTANEAQFVARAFKLSIEMSMLPYAPKVERIIAHQLPVVIDIMPKTLKSDDTIKTLNVTIKYLGPLYLNYLAIFITFDQIPNKKYDCTKKPPNNIQLLNDNGTILPCSIGGVAPGRGQIILSFNSLNATTNVSVDFPPNADDLKITLSDFRDREVMLNCRAFDASMDTLIFHVQNNLSTTIAQLRQRNDIQIPVGDDTILPNQNSFKVRRNSPDVAGVFPIPWYCADSLDIVKSTPAKLEITFLPAANCQMNQAVKNMFVLDNVRSNLTYLNMSIVFRTVPEFGKLIDSQNADISLLAGSIYDKPSVKYRVDKTIQSATSGSFSYYVEQNGLQSDICNVAFTIACAPLYLNIFDNSTDALCVPCPVGANCDYDGTRQPFAATGYWKSEDTNIYLPCVPESACPGEESRICREGYRGYRCGECEKKWYKLNDECHKCNDNVAETILIVLACIIGGAIIVGFVLRLTSTGPGMGFATITVNFIQMIIVVRDIKLNWTPEFHLVLNSISFLNFNVELTSPECFILDEPINFSLKLRLTLAIPLLLFGILAVIALYNSMTILRLKNRYVPAIAKILKFKFVTLDEVSMQKKHTESVFRILRGFNAILLFVYVTVASKSLAFFDCTKMSDGNYYLDADPSLRCNEGEAWRQADMPIAVLGVLFYVVGIPIYFLVQFSLLYQTQKSGPFWTRAKEICRRLVSQNSYMKPQFQYFLLVQIIQKLFVIVVKQFFTNYVALQIVLTIALAVFGYGVYSKYHPYAYMSLNYLEIQSVISSAIILALGLLLYTNQFPHDDQKMVITALLLALVFGFLLSVIVAIVHELHQAGKEKYGNLSNAVTAMKQTIRRASLVVKTTRTSPQSQVVRQAEIKESEEVADPSAA